MPLTRQFLFEPFRLDPHNACLWRGERALALTPKAFAVLQCLVTHAGQLVTKEVLLQAVWPATAVGDAVLKVCMREIRKALGEAVQAPQFIVTVYRRGYRFIAPVTVVDPPGVEAQAAAPRRPALGEATDHPPSPYPRPARLVGREAALAQLRRYWEQAQRGVRQVVFVTGEVGIGKTAVVEAFLEQAATAPHLLVARGQCVEHYGPGEAYLPVLEALSRLCRAPGGARLTAMLRRQAPTWLVQLPWLLDVADRDTLQRELLGVTRERMLREWAELVDTLTSETPAILLLEDLHWSDYATVDLLAVLARRRELARLLVLGTYRPVDVIVRAHPLQAVKQELQLHGHCQELALEGLSAGAVAEYLTARCPESQLSGDLVPLLQRRTEGHPLFMVTVVEELVSLGVIGERHERGGLHDEVDAVEVGVPEGLRQLLAQQIERLSVQEQQLLETASVAGGEFSAAAVAAALEEDVVAVEERCEGLARRLQWLRPAGTAAWPDGTVAGCYAFSHALYQQVGYQRVPAARQMQLHLRTGARLERAYGPNTWEIAAELAMHFERGRDYRRAVHYLRQAADNAVRRYAHREAIRHLTQGLALIELLPDTPERAQQELDLQLALGLALSTTRGYAATEVEQTYTRARALCQQLGETPQLFPTLRGLWRFYISRGVLSTARELGKQLLRQVQSEAAPLRRLGAHEAFGTTLFHLGEYAAARIHYEQGIALTDSAVPQPLGLRQGVVPGVTCLAHAALTLWCLGYPAQAMQRSQEALRLAQALAHPHSLAVAQFWAASLRHRRREAPAVQVQTDTLLTLATAQGFPLWAGLGTCLRGWALAMHGQGEAGMAQLRQGMAAVLATGQGLARPLYLVLLAEVMGHAGQVAEGLCLLTEALAAFKTSGRGDALAEVYRLQGEFLVRQALPDVSQAEACFQQALAVARCQQAKSWELRAAVSLSRLWQQQGKRAAARDLLAPIYGWFTEGFDTADLQAAQALLQELQGQAPRAHRAKPLRAEQR